MKRGLQTQSEQKRNPCPKCGSENVRRDYFKGINIGCLLVNAMTFAALFERPNLFARACRDCRHRFVNT